MSDLVKRDTDSWADVLPAVGDLAGKIAATDFVPDGMRGKPAVVAACILYGREIGMGPMQSLHAINVIKGRPSLSAEAMRAMVLAAGHDIAVQEMTNARCVMVGKRRGSDNTTTVTFTLDDAKRMNLAGQAQYTKMPRQMLAARATAELCRLIFADVIGGLVADIEADDDPAAPISNVTPITTAKRKKAPAEVPPEADAPAAEPEPVVDEEPPLDDDIVDAEIVESDDLADWEKELLAAKKADDTADLPPVTQEAVANVRAVMDADIIDVTLSGPELLRQELAKSKAKKKEPPFGPITPMQLKALQAGFKECGIDGREDRLSIAARVAGRPDLSSANDLTAMDAKNVLDALAHAKGTTDPAETLRIGY